MDKNEGIKREKQTFILLHRSWYISRYLRLTPSGKCLHMDNSFYSNSNTDNCTRFDVKSINYDSQLARKYSTVLLKYVNRKQIIPSTIVVRSWIVNQNICSSNLSDAMKSTGGLRKLVLSVSAFHLQYKDNNTDLSYRAGVRMTIRWYRWSALNT